MSVTCSDVTSEHSRAMGVLKRNRLITSKCSSAVSVQTGSGIHKLRISSDKYSPFITVRAVGVARDIGEWQGLTHAATFIDRS